MDTATLPADARPRLSPHYVFRWEESQSAFILLYPEGLIKLNPHLFWPAIGVATAGNTLGGALSWWMGLGAHKVVDKAKGVHTEVRALAWLKRFGAKACLLSWLPVVGDPLCAVAGWLKLPFWPCVAYMAIGKFLRYLTMTSLLLQLWPGLFTH